MWEAIEIDNWKDTPCIYGRAATEDDVSEGRAVFYVPTGSEPFETDLPLFAIQIDEDTNKRTPCVVIQIENTPEGTAVGVRYMDGGNGIGMASEFEFYSEIPNDINL